MTVQGVIQVSLDFLYGKITFEDLMGAYEEYMKLSDKERENNIYEMTEKYSALLDFLKEEKNILYYYFLSFSIYATKQTAFFREFLKSCLEDASLDSRTKFSLYYYTVRLCFLGIVSSDAESAELSDLLYQQILEAFAKEVGNQYEYIARENRNQEKVFVMIGQVLGLTHGPTKTLFDRCEVLKKSLKKEVSIINAVEVNALQTKVPLFRMAVGGYVEEYCGKHIVPYHDEVYPLLQCSREMPDVPEIREILDLVAKEKPLCIVTIGGNSIVSDLCSRIVPTIVVSTVPSGRVQTRGQFQAIGRRPGEADFAWAGKHHLPKEHFIESVFTSSFKKQEHSYTRQDLELPENGFIAAMVGGRLSDEVDGKCMDMLEKLMAQGIYVAFIGGFRRFEEFRRMDALFAKYAIDMGKQDDVLAVLECMDLYMNPKRIGGGTSVAEALYKGVPVVTLDYGDGGLGAGEDFFVKDYEDMHETVLRYAKDKEFYSEMSKKAKERAAILTNSEKEFVRLMNTAMSRDAFQ